MHQNHQQTAYNEVRVVFGDRDPTFEDTKDLTFLDMFIKEGIKLIIELFYAHSTIFFFLIILFNSSFENCTTSSYFFNCGSKMGH